MSVAGIVAVYMLRLQGIGCRRFCVYRLSLGIRFGFRIFACHGKARTIYISLISVICYLFLLFGFRTSDFGFEISLRNVTFAALKKAEAKPISLAIKNQTWHYKQVS